jgi:hypothetical protein
MSILQTARLIYQPYTHFLFVEVSQTPKSLNQQFKEFDNIAQNMVLRNHFLHNHQLLAQMSRYKLYAFELACNRKINVRLRRFVFAVGVKPIHQKLDELYAQNYRLAKMSAVEGLQKRMFVVDESEIPN